MIEAELADGRVLEFPDGTDPRVIQATVKKVLGAATKPQETTFGGVASEVVKGGLRGAGDVGSGVAQAVTAPFGPLGALARRGIDFLAAPSREMVRASPATEAERFAGTAAEIVGAGAAGGGASSVKAAIANTVAGLAGAAGEQIGGEIGQAVGTITPGIGGLAVQAAKSPMAKKVAENLKTFQEAGTAPSVGQATESSFIRGLENLMAKFPGGVRVMRDLAENQQAGIGAKIRTGVSAEDAGRAIEKGVGGFLGRTKEAWQKLDEAVAAKVPQGASFAPANTAKALDELTTPVTGAEKTTGALVNPKIADLKANIQADLQANNGVMPFEALRALRSRVGSMLDDALVTGIPGGELKKLYGALSKDLEGAANQAGAGVEFARQNNYWRARMGRVEDVLERVVGKGKLPEDIFKAFNPTDPDQANKVRAVMRSLTPAERTVVSEAMVNRLGRATPGKQNEFGDVFSTETFLTNWNKLSDGAKAQMFPNHSMRANINSVAKVANNLREGSKTFANPSGTAGVAAPYGLGAMAATGNIVPAAGMILTANLGAKLLTSPKFVEWLAKSPSVKPENMAPHLARLSAIFNQADEGVKAELEQFMASTQ